MAAPGFGGWLVCPRPDPAAVLRLFCFPYAGGGAGVYRRWPAAMPAGVEVCAVQLPGREGRLRETPFNRMGPLVDALAAALRPHLDRPFAFFGHSMGALLAFELARRLRREGLPGPLHLFVSGRRPPQDPDREERLHGLSDAQLRDALRRLGGTPREVLEHDEMMRLLTPMLRADLAVVETYRHEPAPPLDCPVTVLGALDDPKAPAEGLPGWAGHTRGPFRVRTLPGNHFFLHSAEAQVLGVVSQELTPLVSGAAAGTSWPVSDAVPPLAGDEVHVWRMELERTPESLAELERTLAPDERQRADRFLFPHDRHRFIAARGTLRTLLGRYLGREPAGVPIRTNAQGKPELDGEGGGLRFNLAHSHGLALFAFTRGREVGVDLEKVRADLNGEQLAERFFSAREVEGLRSLPPGQRREAFFACWTRKEAYLKATGMGLRLPLDCFDVSLAPAAAALLETRHDPAEAGRWSLCDLAPAPGYAGALAALGHGWRLRCGEWAGRPDGPAATLW
jgi:medium-chain acyl-[acyl-carrier-protein] hydrolase